MSLINLGALRHPITGRSALSGRTFHRRRIQFVQKTALSVESRSLELIARDLLIRAPGDRIPAVAQYQRRFSIGSGTVQARLRTLEAIGAITLEARGRRGTFLKQRDVAELWSHGRLAPARGVLPLPEAFEPVSLAAVMRREFQALGVPLELLYLHGSARRVDLLRAGEADFAILSEPAAQHAIRRDTDHWVVTPLGEDTYNTDGSMVVLVRPHLGADDRLTRIGIDPDSFDQGMLTRAEFPEEEGHVYAPYPHSRFPALVAEGAIDAAIWHRTTLAIPLSLVGVDVRPLHRLEAISARAALGRAVVVSPAAALEVRAALAGLNFSQARMVQDEIRRSEVLPLY